VRPDWANFRHLGDIFRRWANFFWRWAHFFWKISPKIHINKLQIWAIFCLKIPKFWPKISLGKSSYLLRLHFGRYFNQIGRIFHKTSGHTVKRPRAKSYVLLLYHPNWLIPASKQTVFFQGARVTRCVCKKVTKSPIY
jgi:hypothetical protein